MMFSRLAALSAVLWGASSAVAVPVTVIGPRFDISFDSALVGLFGTPVVVGNQVSWFPSGSPGFTARTSSGFDVTNSTFALKVTAHPGFQLSSFSLAEAGDYFYFGSGALVAVSGQLRVTPLPGSTTTDAITATTTFAPNAFLDFGTHNWAADAGTIAVPGGTTTANVSIQNILAAFVPSTTVGFSFIEKKDVFLSVGVLAAVPEPETYGMMLSGLGLVALLALRRRRRD